MLLGAHSLKALTPKDTLAIQRGSCVRHRFARSSCTACFDICPSRALSWGTAGLQWDAARCRGCLLCTAVCPSGALQGSELAYIPLLKNLAQVETPILACSICPQTLGHARLPCLGVLANFELLLAFSLALGKPLKLNLSACTDCRNAAILDPLHKALQKFAEMPGDSRNPIVAEFNPQALDFKERNCNRREFFTLLRARSQQTGLGLIERLSAEPPKSYAAKQLPPSRELLLQVLRLGQPNQPDVQQLFPRRTTREGCTNCTGCVGICPTNALQPATPPQKFPNFIAENCIACHLCEELCPRSGLQILPPV